MRKKEVKYSDGDLKVELLETGEIIFRHGEKSKRKLKSGQFPAACSGVFDPRGIRHGNRINPVVMNVRAITTQKSIALTWLIAYGNKVNRRF